MTQFNAPQVKNMAQINGPVIWKPPSNEIVKVNFDGVTDTREKKGGVEVVIRDCTGEVLATASITMPGINDPFHAEAYLATQALMFASNMGFKRIILEGDALGIIKTLNSTGPDLSTIEVTTEEANEKKNQFHTCLTMHTQRKGNMKAHLR
ncbi:uncharacterized protein LOC111303203 [Durio zibethinus]|uniref:Uncharacterized protein LOC111303203 n=1 Tax=Durio zibethinus TaxID=66656 RepID=A0A6P5ZQ88_DURZI|nr:uncharacterized protein LOC111303203 [Durio zibethinus]